MDIVPMLVEILRDGKRVEKALAADVCTLLAKEQINRYALAEAPGLLHEAGKCLKVKVPLLLLPSLWSSIRPLIICSCMSRAHERRK